MVKIPTPVREELKTPLGKIYSDPNEIKKIGKLIVAIGDVCTLELLKSGIIPHLAVFDYFSMRKPLSEKEIKILENAFPKRRTYQNPPGTLSDELLRDAKELLNMGGAVFIQGEEDLTALAFLRVLDERFVVLYGQPGVGMVVVLPSKEIKEKIEKWLSTATLRHEVKSDK